MQFVHYALAGAATAALAAAAAPPTAAAQQRGTAAERQQRNPVDTYLAQKQREFAASERAALARGIGGRVTALYNLLRDKGPFRGRQVVGSNAEEQEKVRDALVRTTAYYLASVGMDADEVNALQRAGLDPLAAGAAVIGGGATLYDALTVSETAVIATVTANGGEGIERQLSFTPVRVLKGSAPGPFTLTVPLPHPPADAEEGEQFLLFLSSELGAYRRAAGRRGNDGALAQQLAPYRLDGGRLTPTIPGQDEGGRSLADVDAFVAKHQAAFAAPGNGAK